MGLEILFEYFGENYRELQNKVGISNIFSHKILNDTI